MKLDGDPEGVAALKALSAADKEQIKFLIHEAQTNTDRKTTFRAADGRVFVLRVDPQTKDLTVEPA
ncbi:MAG: hypothetical protein AB7S26_13090 [Sandaracinaceae bacterium]